MPAVPDLPIFPDAVSLVRTWLLEHLDVPVIVDVRNDEDLAQRRPPTFVRLKVSGGVQHNLVTDAPRILFEAWAQTKEAAHDLAQEAHVLVRLLPFERGQIHRVEAVGGLADVPDPLSDTPRFKFSFVLHTRGAPYELAGS